MATVDIGGIDYGYVEVGTGPLVLFGHGTFGGKALLRRQTEALADRYRCVAVDWPGHAESSYDPDGWTVQDLVDAVPQLIEAFGEPAAALAGVSQGGAIFMRAAIAHPDRVSALVIMCAGPDRPSAGAVRSLQEFGDILALPGNDALRRRSAEAFLARIFHRPGFAAADPDAFAAELELVLAHDRAAMPLVAGVPAGYDSIGPRLKEISCPTSVVWGSHDSQLPMAARIAEAIPDAELHVVHDAGHHVNVDAPSETAAIIREFLDRRLARG